MISGTKVCKKCNRTTSNFEKRENAWCLDCRIAALPWNNTLTCRECGCYVERCGDTTNICTDCRANKFKAILKAEKEKKAIPTKTQATAGRMAKGEIKKLEKNTSPFNTEQWAVQGSGKFPYIVTHKNNQAASDSLEWQCSCPAWTTATPRKGCKHVLKIKLSLGIGVAEAKVLAAVASSNGALVVKQGRKFRL